MSETMTVFVMSVVCAAMGFLAKYAVDGNTAAIHELRAAVNTLSAIMQQDRERLVRLEEWRASRDEDLD